MISRIIKNFFLGEPEVGIPSITSQFTTNKFNLDRSTSLSSQYISTIINFPKYKKAIKFDIWDNAGQKKYHSLAKIF